MTRACAIEFPMNFFSKAARLINMASFLRTHRQLLLLLFRRDIEARTSGTVLGGLWMLLQPALQVAALWFLLDVVLNIRFPGLDGGFVAYFLLGMVPWLMLNEIMQRSLTVMTDYASLYQRANFPMPLLPLVPWMVSGAIYGATIIVVALLLAGWQALPGALILVAGLLVWLLPFCYLLAVIGLFVRDLQQLAPFILTMFMYMTPILYVPQAFPKEFAWWLDVNPFAHLMVLDHALIQGHDWTWLNLSVPVLLWLLALLPARRLFLKAAPHMREAL
ncbi:MAG: ABC transporter permease [Pseudomonadota bacterium]